MDFYSMKGLALNEFDKMVKDYKTRDWNPPADAKVIQISFAHIG